MKDLLKKITGNVLHFGAVIMFLASLQTIDYTIQNIMLAFLISGMVFTCLILWYEYKYPIMPYFKNSQIDYYNFMKDTFFSGIIVGDLCVIIVHLCVNFIMITIRHDNHNVVMRMIVVFLLVDMTYFWIHKNLMHNLKGNKYNFMYILHRMHHSIKNINYIRGTHASVIENGVIGYQLWVGIYGGLLGLDIRESLVVIHVILLLQLSHHANHDFDIGIVKYIFMDNHSHKIHHHKKGAKYNFGGVMSIWDILDKSFVSDQSKLLKI